MRLVSVNVGYMAQRRKNKSRPVGQNNELNELLCTRLLLFRVYLFISSFLFVLFLLYLVYSMTMFKGGQAREKKCVCVCVRG